MNNERLSTTNCAPRVRVIPVRTVTDRNEQNLAGEKRIGVYVRVSTELDSQASSYEIQVSYFKEYVQKSSVGVG